MMAESAGIIFDVLRYAIHDGPGIRTTVFFKGCPIRCLWCANPESQDPGLEISYLADRCVLCGRCVEACPNQAVAILEGVRVLNRKSCRACGRCAETCPTGAVRLVGRTATVGELFEEIVRDRIFWERSGGGVTLSGGEPLSQPAPALDLLKICREHHVSTAVESCLHVPTRSLEEVLPQVNHFICDLKTVDEAKHVRLTGVSNALIKKNLAFLLQAGQEVLVRMPLIPGLNDAPADLEALGRFLQSLGGRLHFEILPYHRLGEPKYERLGRAYALKDLAPPTAEQVAAARGLLESYHLKSISY
ncbi:MAG: glycyl-radical enzyme activating protein [Thermodesulfobacteriota bacterium]